MKLCKIAIKKLILIIVLISILITFLATPVSNAALDLEDGEFYYAGSTEGSYKPGGTNIFAWILKALGDIADFILGLLTLAPRMVFVGWTALVEKALTWAVESSAGVSSDGSIVENPTDLTALTDSGNNITVEAIVYNKVAALNADIFDLEMDRTLSPTGHRLVCDKCGIYTDDYGLKRYSAKYVDECCNQAMVEQIIANPDNYKDTLFKQVTIEDVPGFCSCACGGDETCYGCSMYFEQLTVEKPTIILIKENIATWYYIIRMLAMAIMLVVLIAVGIKMALSTIASDKAVYKRMLVDWVVGVIMLFTLHYFMVFVINLNAITVGIVEETAQKVNQASLAQAAEDLNMDLQDELHSKDLEIRVYEEIRTRAYDAKLSNGIIGMVMYMALVFMAVKYTFIYLKRLLTIMVLTLMAPGVGVAYALQKVLTGKSQALKTWMTEYIMNVIIQTIHALIYAIFISQALILSLTNIAGMIVALVFLNYAAKAEETFKKIFKFGGKDSLVGHTDNAMEAMSENISSGYNMAKGLVMGTSPAAKLLTNTPYAKALKGVGKAAIAGGAVAGKKYLDTRDERKENKENKKYNKAYEKEFAKVESEYASRPERSNKDAEIEEMQAEVEKRLLAKGIIKPVHIEKEDDVKERLKKAMLDTQARRDETLDQISDAHTEILGKNEQANPQGTTQQNMENKTNDAEKQKQEATDKRGELKNLTRMTREEASKLYIEKIFNIDNYFKLSKADGILDFKTHSRNAGIISDGVFGTTTFDPIKMKYVSNNDAVYQKLFSEQMFGLSSDDKKMFKEHVMPLLKGLGGMGALFVGMGTIVTNPKIGMGLLATGTAGISGATKKRVHIKRCADRYKFARFENGALKNISRAAIKQARKERRHERAENIKTKRADFAERFRSGDIKAVTLGVAAGVAAGPIMPVVFAYKGAKAMFHPKETFGKMKHTGQEVANMIKNPGETIGNMKDATVTFGKGIVSSTGEGISNGVKAVSGRIRKVRTGGSYDANRSTTVKSFMGEKVQEGKDFGKKAGSYVAGKFTRVLSQNEHYASLVDYKEKKMREFENKLMEDTLTLAGEQSKALFTDTYTKESESLGQSDKTVEQRIEAAAMLGYDYDQKSNQMTRKETVRAADIDETKLAPVEVGGKPSQRVLDEALTKVLERYSQQGKLDLSSKGLQDKVIKEINTELISSKIIQAGESVETVFKGGKTELVKVLKGKAGKIQDQAKTETDLRRVLSKDQIGKIDDAIRGAKKGASISDILAGVSGIVDSSKDGSSKVSTADGGVSFDGRKNGDRAVTGDTSGLVRSYIAARHSTPKTTEYVRSKKKVAQVMEALLPDIPTTDETEQQSKPQVDILQLISQVNAIARDTTKESGTITVGDKEVVLLAREAQSMKKVLPRYFDMTEVNRDAIELDISKASSGYKKDKKQKETLDTQIGQLETQLKYMGDENTSGKPYSRSKSAIDAILGTKQAERKQLETRMATKGPIVPVSDLVRKINGTDKDGSKKFVEPKSTNGRNGSKGQKNGTGGGKK